ncbi:MAG: ArnT family glycosyltransferase [Saprospiraceae bacterium]
MGNLGAIKKDHFVIVLLGILFYLPFLGGVHLFDWDEINFAEAAREMIVSGDYFHVQIDYLPFWEKPPLFIWMQVLAMKLFGVNEFAARFPNAICGIVTLLFLFSIGKKLHGRFFGWVWVLTYLGSILPHLYFRSGIIDPWFNLLIFSSLYYLIIVFSNQENSGQVKSFFDKNKHLFFGGVLLGLAVLTKGPAAILLVGLTGFVYWISVKFKMYFTISQLLIYGFSAILVTALWFGVEWIMNGSWFIKEFTTYQIRLFSTPDAGHGGFPGYHFVVLLLGCFPASIFAIPALWESPLLLNVDSQKWQIDFRKWMLILFWVVLILFSIVQSKIVHYSSLCYFPLTYLSATYLFAISKNEKTLNSKVVITLLFFGFLISSIFIAVPFVGKNIEILKSLFAKDLFALGNLEAEIPWSYLDIIPGLFLLITTLISVVIFWGKGFGKKYSFRKSIVLLFSGSAIFITLSLIFFINKIEGYSQNAVIEFYKSLEGKDVYVKNVGFKSYAPLFYTKKQDGLRKENRSYSWLTEGEIDRDVYFVTKVNNDGGLRKYEGIEEVGRKNGFVFFKRSLP